MDRQVLTTPEASERCLDGHVAEDRHERTSDYPQKAISVSVIT